MNGTAYAAWLAAFWIAWLGFDARTRPTSQRDRARFLVALVLGAASAHLGWALFHPRAVLAHPRALLDPSTGYSVLFLPLGVLGAAPWRAPRARRARWLAAALGALPLALAVARLGCLAAGCCLGTPADVAWAVRSPAGARVHPTPLYEIAGLLALFLCTGQLPRRCVPAAVLAGLGLVRIAVEPWRAPPPLGTPALPPALVAGAWLAIAAALAPRRRHRSDAACAGRFRPRGRSRRPNLAGTTPCDPRRRSPRC